jgi:hypothetical protein
MNLYHQRDAEELGDYYIRHVGAMTAEGLHAKSDIAAELAHRDREIDRLRASLGAIHYHAKTTSPTFDKYSVLWAVQTECEHAIPELEDL